MLGLSGTAFEPVLDCLLAGLDTGSFCALAVRKPLQGFMCGFIVHMSSKATCASAYIPYMYCDSQICVSSG